MSPSSAPICTHDRGPGTTVCLRCRHEQAKASQLRRQRFLMQFLGLGSVVAIIGVVGVGFASTLRNRPDGVTTTSEGNVATPEQRPVAKPHTPAVVQQARAAPADSAPPAAVAPTPAPVTAPSAGVSASPRSGFVLVEGRTQLTDSIYAIRTGDSVIVNFDRFGYRTRRSDKLESSLRLTLPMVFGRTATADIDTLKENQLVTNRDVIGSLASEGMRLTLANGANVRLRVLTRVGRDGPLAVGYLATIDR